MENKKNYTISVYTENNIGLLHRLSAIFLKRHINIESFTTSECEIKDVFRFIIVVKMTKDDVQKVAKQIEKQVEVIRVFYHTDNETIFQESALYKMKSSSLFKESNARIVTVNPDFFVIEKTGFRDDTEKLYKDLEEYGLLQFTRSGRIAVSKEKMGISEILNTFKNQK
jgi:acetolactate synthase-1/3 small subunit